MVILAEEERYTFSSIMTLLIESEDNLRRLYEAAAKDTNRDELRLLLSNYGKSSSRRIEMMRRARNETVMEITLEPITDLKLIEPLARIKDTIQDKQLSNLEKAITIETIVAETYAKVSPKVMQMSTETSELLMALSRESNERREGLKEQV